MTTINEAIRQEKFASEHEKAVINLVFTSGWVQGILHRFLKQYDISPQQYNVLRILRGQHPAAASVSLIQERMLDKMSNASRLVEKLKLKGLVKRSECPNDRRQVDVVITGKGLELLEEIGQNPEHLQAVEASIHCDEAKQLNYILDKLRTNQNKQEA